MNIRAFENRFLSQKLIKNIIFLFLEEREKRNKIATLLTQRNNEQK
jgi:hypothetical protein